MSDDEEDISIIEQLSVSNISRLVPHPDEGHVRPDPELRTLIEDLKRAKGEAAARRRVKERDTPDAA